MKETKFRDYEIKNKHTLVTGGAGFIGSHLTERLLQFGTKVIVIDKFSAKGKENLKEVLNNPNLKIIKGDVNNFKTLKEIFESYPIDYVFHYAGVVGVKRIYENPNEVLKDIEGTKHILYLSLLHNIKKIIFASSAEIAREPSSFPKREGGIYNPRDFYALVKLIGENLMQFYWKKYRLPTCILRFSNVYGPRQDYSPYGYVVGIFIHRVLNGKPPTVFGNGLQKRNFIYIDDDVELAIRALLSKKTNGEVIDIGFGKQTTIIDLAEKIIRLCGRKLKPEFFPSTKIDILYRPPDTKKMKRLLKYTPRYSLEGGLKKTINFYISRNLNNQNA